MKKYKYEILAFAIVLFMNLLSSCKLNLEKEKQYTSKFELRQLLKTTETTKYASGCFFLIAGEYSSGESQETKVKVFAKVNGCYKLLEIPIDMVRIKLNNKVKNPNVMLTYYSDYKENDEYISNEIYRYESAIIECSEEMLPERLLPIKL